MILSTLIKRVQFKLDDPTGAWCDDDYVKGFVQDVYDWLYNEIKLTGAQFDSGVVVLPAVGPGITNLDPYQQPEKELEFLVNPRIVRWRISGLDDANFRRAQGPLDYVRDLADPGLPLIDSWAWQRNTLMVSKTSIALDIEVSGDFLPQPLTDPGQRIAIALNCSRALTSQLAADIAKARGNQAWVTQYSTDAMMALDSLAMLMVKAQQGKTQRVGRTGSGRGGGIYGF